MLQSFSALIWVLLATTAGLATVFSSLRSAATLSTANRYIAKAFPGIISAFAAVSLFTAFHKLMETRVVNDHEITDIIVNPANSQPSLVSFNTFSAVNSAIGLTNPTNGIDCSQVQKANGMWNIIGTIQVGGATFSHIGGVAPRAFNVSGHDLATLIDEKCPQIELPPVDKITPLN